MSGADNPRGQNFDVNRNHLSLRSFAISLKKSPSSLILHNFFHYFIHVYEVCSEIIETLAFYPELIDVGKQNSA